jgi:tetratricopeptide (TPR) repeat protein
MKYSATLFFTILFGLSASAQPDDAKTMHQNARTFMVSGDFDNAILVLNRALQQDRNNLDMQKDLVQCFYFKKDYVKAIEGIKVLIEREDTDVMTFQIAGNIYKALEDAKECEKVYKKGLKKFPKSGPLYSEYGELLWSKKDYEAIELWERGIEVDPAYGGNYYNAAVFYFYTKEKVWSLIYGEIFVNMESLTERGAAMKQLLLDGYKEKLFAEADLLKGEEKNKSEFAKSYLGSMAKLSGVASKGINTETLIMIRSRFILDWYANNATKFPFRLFDFQRQLLQEGMFEAYNHWLFGPVENLAAYENWTKTHSDEYTAFTNFQKSRVFRMPTGQYYQGK